MEKKNYIAAIDLGSSSVTIAVGTVDTEGRLEIADIVSRPTDGVTRGEITNRQQVAASIKEVIEEIEHRLSIRIADVYTGVSGRHIKCSNHDYFVFVGERSDGEIRKEDVLALHDGMNNVQAEDGIKILDRIPQNYIVDGRDEVKDPVGRFGKKLESTFCFILGSSTPIDRLEKTLLGLGIKPLRTFANALASAEAVTLPEEKEIGAAVIDLGAGTTDLTIYYDNVVRFVRGIPFGAGDINHDIHQQGILDRHVENLKTQFGCAVADEIVTDKLIGMPGRTPRDRQEISQKNLAIIIENRLKDIIRFVQEEIADSGYVGRLAAGIVLTGGCSQLQGIDELFRRETGMEVRLATPDLRVTEASKEIASKPEYATAIGILLQAMASGKFNRVEKISTIAGNRFAPRPQPTPVHEPARPVHVPEPENEPTPEENDPTETNDDEEEIAKGKEHKEHRKGKGLDWWNRVKNKLDETFFPETLEGDEDF